MAQDFTDKMTDVFGQALRAYLNGGSSLLSLRKNDQSVDFLDTGVYFSRYLDWPDYEKEIITKYTFGRVLDIGAGAGRHSIFLQNKGFNIHAIDNSPIAVNIMRIRGVRNVYLMNLRELNFPDNYFDSVLMMFTDFGLAGNHQEIKKFLKNLYIITSTKGRIITTIRYPYKTNNRIRMRLEYSNSSEVWFRPLMIWPEKLEDFIKSTGWLVLKTIKGEAGFYGAVLAKKDIRLA